MIISRTPYRISFLGGGTDYPGWYLKHGGQVLSTTIDKYIHIFCRYLPPFFEHRLRLVYSKIETCQHVSELDHPSAREVLKYMDIDNGLEIHYDGDLPGRSGLGSSSAFTVGLLNALYAYQGQKISQHRLTTESIHIEQTIVGEKVGSQDQVSAAYGGFNTIRFSTEGQITVEPVIVNENRIKQLNNMFMLFFSGISRTASEIADTYVNDLNSRRRQLKRMSKMVDEAAQLVRSNTALGEFGELLHESWILKRSLSPVVSNSKVDQAYDTARRAGALGGKLTGAGGGGMLLLCVPPERREMVREKLSGLVHIPFCFEQTGSQIIFRDIQQRYQESEQLRRTKLKGGKSILEESVTTSHARYVIPDPKS